MLATGDVERTVAKVGSVHTAVYAALSVVFALGSSAGDDLSNLWRWRAYGKSEDEDVQAGESEAEKALDVPVAVLNVHYEQSKRAQDNVPIAQ